MFISWDPPHTLPGLTVQYIISVETEQHVLISTNYTYCPLNPSNEEYQFNITTSNKAGIGSSSDVTIDFSLQSGMNSYYYIYMLNCIGSFYYLSRRSYLFLEYPLEFIFPCTSELHNDCLHFSSTHICY